MPLVELVAAIERSRSRERNLKSLTAALGAWRLCPFNATAAFEYGRLYAELAKQGRPIGTVDLMIAAVAKALGWCTVISTDSDLRAMPGLAVADWRT